jgi:TonB family protein
MKKCDTCGEEFETNFSFCPIDGTQFGNVVSAQRSFHLTLIEEAPLARRLAAEAKFLATRFTEAWPGFKQHPITFTIAHIHELARFLLRTAARPYALPGAATALAAVLLLILGVLVLDTHVSQSADLPETIDPSEVMTLDFSNKAKQESNSSVGAGKEGRVGFGRGKGEGSNPKPARAQGGGGGGTRNPLPPSQGRPPVASPIPAPIPTTYARLPHSLPAAGLDIDPALWRNLDFASYGDPRSKSTTPSNGPGEGGGVGTGKGLGIGEGEDNGIGRGRKGNMGDGDNQRGSGEEGGGGPGCGRPGCVGSVKVYTGHDVSQRARVLFKPEPQYTEEARRNGLTGTVVLRVVFSSSGQVTNIRTIKTLPGGLTEKAIAAARQIQFAPATRNGQPVSMYMQLEYNFNLY